MGPRSYGNDTKPDVVAPGVDICSAGINRKNHVEFVSGTSFAGPHVAGLAALLLSKNASISTVRKCIISGAKKVESTGRSCGGRSEGVYPNFLSGHGAVNAPAALQCIKKRKTKSR